MRFEGKVVVVTGAARGIGRAVAQAFVQEGARVLAADIDPGEPIPGAEPVRCDVAEESQVRALMERVGPVLHLLVNNAGIGWFGDLESMPVARFDRVIAVNLRGPYLCARYAAPLLRASGAGAIINIASTRALMSEPGGEAYGASKGGILALTHALAISLGPAVRVNCIAPGWIDVAGEPLREIDHAQHPVGRVGRPEDVARACLFLGHPDESGFMTGETIVLDGGMTRKMLYVE
ncbi:MAG TPA: SDR family oxidoreductase [Symbiobacteriaceae bacterium]|nr:SDR family oxidoreductase [Symbiobacteriaceae bacterium]